MVCTNLVFFCHIYYALSYFDWPPGRAWQLVTAKWMTSHAFLYSHLVDTCWCFNGLQLYSPAQSYSLPRSLPINVTTLQEQCRCFGGYPSWTTLELECVGVKEVSVFQYSILHKLGIPMVSYTNQDTIGMFSLYRMHIMLFPPHNSVVSYIPSMVQLY